MLMNIQGRGRPTNKWIDSIKNGMKISGVCNVHR